MTEFNEVRDEELMSAYMNLMNPEGNYGSVGISLAECGATGIPETDEELMDSIEKELKKRGI